jgi:hypothetical protein
MDLGRLRPGFWFQNKPTSAVWDWALNHALDTFGVREVDAHTAAVGPFTVWISNWPYAFGYDRADALELLPKVATRIRLANMVRAFQRQRYLDLMK